MVLQYKQYIRNIAIGIISYYFKMVKWSMVSDNLLGCRKFLHCLNISRLEQEQPLKKESNTKRRNCPLPSSVSCQLLITYVDYTVWTCRQLIILPLNVIILLKEMSQCFSSKSLLRPNLTYHNMFNLFYKIDSVT